MDVVVLLHLTALAAYLGAWGVFLRAFRDAGEDVEALATGWRITAAAGGIHLLALAVFTVTRGSLPLVGLGPASSTLALAIAALLVGASLREEVRPAALFVTPLIVLLLGEAVAVGLEPAARQTAFRGAWFVAHVTVVFVGYAALALASAAGAMYVLQFRTLKRKDFGSIFSFMPPLETLDRLHRTGLAVGFSGLTLGLIAGWSWTLTYGRGWDFGNPQVVFGVVTWVAYLGAILARLVPGGRERRSAAATTAAFVVTAAAFGLLRALTGGSGFFL